MPRLSTAAGKGKVAGKAPLILGLAALLWLTPAWSAEVNIRENSPGEYTVKEGDTLWDIAGMFLEEPWLWPEVWQINPQISDPDLIYPGDVIELAYVDGSPVLRLSRGDVPEMRTVRLPPQVRRELLTNPSQPRPIAAIPLEEISAYLSADYVVSDDLFEDAPYILSGREGRTILAAGHEALARGTWSEGVAVYDIVRPGRDLEDPDTGDDLGIEALQVGTATLTRSDFSEAVLAITSSNMEIREGDRLIPRTGATLDASLMPVPPSFPVDAAIVSFGASHTIAGIYDTLILNAGTDKGIAVGHLLTVQEPAEVVDDRIGKRSLWQGLVHLIGFAGSGEATFSGKNIATVLVYRVFDNASLGVVLDSSREIRMEDRAVTPE